MLRFVLWVIIVVLLIVAIVCYTIYQVLFVPEAEGDPPMEEGVVDCYLSIGSHDYKLYRAPLHGLEYVHIRLQESFNDAPIILFFHGNKGNIGQCSFMQTICKMMRVNLAMVDYRGFGSSPGMPSIPSLYEDSLCTYRAIARLYPSRDIILMGVSMGGAAAIKVASQYPTRCLVVMSSFASISDIILNLDCSPWVKYPVESITRNMLPAMASKELIRRVRCPVLLIHSPDDKLIDYENCRLLCQNIQHNNRQVITIRGGHTTPDFTTRQIAEVINFIGVPMLSNDCLYSIAYLLLHADEKPSRR